MQRLLLSSACCSQRGMHRLAVTTRQPVARALDPIIPARVCIYSISSPEVHHRESKSATNDRIN